MPPVHVNFAYAAILCSIASILLSLVAIVTGIRVRRVQAMDRYARLVASHLPGGCASVSLRDGTHAFEWVKGSAHQKLRQHAHTLSEPDPIWTTLFRQLPRRHAGLGVRVIVRITPDGLYTSIFPQDRTRDTFHQLTLA